MAVTEPLGGRGVRDPHKGAIPGYYINNSRSGGRETGPGKPGPHGFQIGQFLGLAYVGRTAVTAHGGVRGLGPGTANSSVLY